MTAGSAPVLSPVAVLDDDPTGVQTLAGIKVVLDWQPGRIERVLARASALHVLTNTRAFAPDEARALIGSAAAAVMQARSDAVIVLRGDSTLRGHVFEEYLGLCDAREDTKPPVLLLVPALPSAGRVTVGGVHYLARRGERIPLHETEYASDGIFSYRTSSLLEWVEARSSGYFSAADGIGIGLAAIRARGADAVAEALAAAGRHDSPTAVVADGETTADVDTVAQGFLDATKLGAKVVLRGGPTIAAALTGATAVEPADFPVAERVLVVCGSYVSQSTRQLQTLLSVYPSSLVEVDPERLAGGDEAEIQRSASDTRARLDGGLAVLSTPRIRPATLTDLESGRRIALGLADIVRVLDLRDVVTVVKGGVTSALTLRNGFGIEEADVIGPVLPGVALWKGVDDGGREQRVLVVPGNVGDDNLLADIVRRIRERPEA
jgi:uncharacterized protein YgbK (DUF1537 family)